MIGTFTIGICRVYSAQFHVDLKYVEEFDTLGDFTTLMYISCYPKKAEAQAFSAREKRAGFRQQGVRAHPWRALRVCGTQE